ncbi:MAG TPA: dihydropteroate synthase [Chitinophagaceae bacterium]|nr:dihydropteroate synthase [Chitinophagaceae bacterium]
MFTLNCNGRLLTIRKPLVIGIINATPDSFYAGSRQQNVDGILAQAEAMLGAGADLLDIGGQSTRPGSQPISTSEELQRVLPGVEAIHRNFPEAFISIDTYYARVAADAVEAGACLINDISAGTLDPIMLATVAGLRVPYVLMHMQGRPQTMHDAPVYENVTREVLDFLIHKIQNLENAGIKDIIVDPGFGFGKTIAHNFELLRNLGVFRMLNRPLLLGLSRKSTIYKTLGISANDALNGTTVLNTIGLMNGAAILRVHDVKEAVEAVVLVSNVNLQS